MRTVLLLITDSQLVADRDCFIVDYRQSAGGR